MSADNPWVTGPLSLLSPQSPLWVTRVNTDTWHGWPRARVIQRHQWCAMSVLIFSSVASSSPPNTGTSNIFINLSNRQRKRLLRQRSLKKMNQESGNLGLHFAPDEWSWIRHLWLVKKQQPWSQGRYVNPGLIRACSPGGHQDEYSSPDPGSRLSSHSVASFPQCLIPQHFLAINSMPNDIGSQTQPASQLTSDIHDVNIIKINKQQWMSACLAWSTVMAGGDGDNPRR